MRKARYLWLVIVASVIGSCKKDLLQFQHIQQITTNTAATINNIRFLDAATCVASGGKSFYESTVLRSVDGGSTWAVSIFPDAPKEMYGMGVSQDGSVYVSGVDGWVLQSKDKGANWQVKHIDNWLVYKGGMFIAPDTGIFVSSVLQRQSVITRVDANYKVIDEQTFQFGLNNIYMTGAGVGFVIGYGVVMKTTDNGTNWKYLDVDGDNFTAMDIHGNEMWACGSAGSIIHTTDGGMHWEKLRNGNDITRVRYILRAILFVDAQRGWAVGEKGKVIYTNDGGRNWAEYKSFTLNTLRCIAQCPNGDLLIGGDDGSLYRMVP